MRFQTQVTEKIKSLFNNGFLKNIFVLLKGVTISQLISLASLPIITRYFTPTEFGYIAVYLGIAKVLATISTGRYELAIMLPKNNSNAMIVSVISAIFVMITAIISTIIVLLFSEPIAGFFNINDVTYLLYFLPLSIIFFGLNQTAYHWSSRNKNFSYLANTRVIQSSSTSLLNILFGFLNFGTPGLLSGNLSGQFFSSFYLVKKWIKDIQSVKEDITKKVLLKELIDYKNFPYFSMPMGFLNSISGNLLIYVFSIFFSAKLVGFYSHAFRVLNYPLNFITSSFTSVFYQRLNVTNNKLKLYTYSYFSSLIISTVILIPVIFWGDLLFAFVFGVEWTEAGKIAGIITPLAITSFAMRNVSDVFSATRKNEILLGWQSFYLVSGLFVIFLFKDQSINLLLHFFTFVGSVLYTVLAYVGYRILKNNSGKNND